MKKKVGAASMHL